MRKIGELNTGKIHFVIYHDEKDNINPYKVYRKYFENGWHKKLEVKYGNLHSCLLYIEDYIIRH